MGYDGWRLDFVRGFSGVHVKQYMEATLPSFSVGEYWDALTYRHDAPDYNQDAHRQRIVNWINAAGGLAGGARAGAAPSPGRSRSPACADGERAPVPAPRRAAFDVTTKGILHAALERREYWRLSDASGKPPGVMGWWPSRAVTFIENHDTGSTQGHWRFPQGKELQGYAYILTHPGTPSVFWDHLFEWSHLAAPIRRLIDLRKRAGIHCRSEVKILRAEANLYAAAVDGALVMKLGPAHYDPGPQWQVAEAGPDLCVWLKRE